MIFEKKEEIPEDFKPELEAAGCFIEHDGKVLMLLSQDYKHYGSVWGHPAGKLDKEENAEQALIREVKEETGINLKKEDIWFIKRVHIRSPGQDFIYNLFYTKFDEKPEVQIDKREHKEFQWLEPEKCFSLKLIPDEDLAIKLLLKFRENKPNNLF